MPEMDFSSAHRNSSASGSVSEQKTVPADTQRKIIILAAVSTSSMVLGVTCVMPLLPMLAEKFSVPLYSMSLLIIAFTMPGILFTPFAGILADKYGRKVILAPALLLFCLAGGACAFAPNFYTLIFLRFLQGIGCTPLGVLNTTILGDTFSGPTLSKVMGYNMSLLSVSAALYPAISGFLAQIDWHIPFLLPFLSFPAFFIALRTPLRGPGKPMSFLKYSKNVLSAISTPGTSKLLLITFLTFVMLYGPIITCYPIIAHRKFSSSPGHIGLMMMFYSFSSGIVASQLGYLSSRLTKRRLLFYSQFCYIIALLAIPFMPAVIYLAPFLALYGIGQGLNIPNVQTALIQNSSPDARASVMAMNGMLLRLGQTIAPFFFSLMVDWRGLAFPFWIAATIPLLMIVLAYKLPTSN